MDTGYKNTVYAIYVRATIVLKIFFGAVLFYSYLKDSFVLSRRKFSLLRVFLDSMGRKYIQKKSFQSPFQVGFIFFNCTSTSTKMWAWAQNCQKQAADCMHLTTPDWIKINPSPRSENTLGKSSGLVALFHLISCTVTALKLSKDLCNQTNYQEPS